MQLKTELAANQEGIEVAIKELTEELDLRQKLLMVRNHIVSCLKLKLIL